MSEQRAPTLRPEHYYGQLTAVRGVLERMEQLLTELVEVDSGESLGVPRLLLLDGNAGRNPVEFDVEAPDNFHSVKIDNPTDLTVYVAFASGGGTPAMFEEIVPPRTGRILTRPYEQCSIGVDPVALGTSQVRLPVTFYSRPLAPASWALPGTAPSGQVKTYLVANPAAGADWSEAVPAGVVWYPLTVVANFAASATVANRYPRLALNDGTTDYAKIQTIGAYTANVVAALSWGVGLPTITQGDGGSASFPLWNRIPVPAGNSIKSVTTGIQAADQWSAIALRVLEVAVDSAAEVKIT